SADSLVALAEDDHIDAKITDKQSELEAAKNADKIKQRHGLRTASLPELPGELSAALSKTIEASPRTPSSG
ncbi:MAG: hypothetical protein OXC54_09845, partial [Rhodospirillaceae bacterium]|nr:hypothetical protein [Rhodospirillaceae bacterium]